MECLMKIQYTDDSMDIAALRRGLVTGDKKMLLPIFEWIFENEDLIEKLSYLARFGTLMIARKPSKISYEFQVPNATQLATRSYLDT